MEAKCAEGISMKLLAIIQLVVTTLFLFSCNFPTESYRHPGYPSLDHGPKVTPDGRYVIYHHTHFASILKDGRSTYIPDSTGLWITGMDGLNPHLLLLNGGFSFDISRDGAWLVYLKDWKDIQKVRLTGDYLDPGSDVRLFVGGGSHPRWNHTGSWIAFTYRPNAEVENSIICKIASDGSQFTIIGKYWQNVYARQSYPDWSPTEKYVLFTHGPGQAASSDILLVDTTGYPFRPIIQDKNANMNASYSPDGSKIIFQTSWTESLIKISRDDGSDVRVVTAGSDPSWTPDGRSIVFLRRFTDEINFRNNSSVWLINTDGTGLRQVTFGPP